LQPASVVASVGAKEMLDGTSPAARRIADANGLFAGDGKWDKRHHNLI
jgi:hypothetical protein